MKRRQITIGPRSVLQTEIEHLKARLEMAEDTLHAIQGGAVDAIILHTDAGERVYSFDEAERPYRLLIEEMSQGAVTLNPKGEILYFNRFFANLVGFVGGELAGRFFHQLVDDDDREAWSGLFSSSDSTRLELNLVTAAGDRRPVSITMCELIRSGEVDLGLIVTDLRDQKQTESLLRDRASREEAARANAEKRFHEAQTANRLKDEFLASLSHELRTPLNVIIGNIDLLVDNLVDADEVPAILEVIHRNAKAQMQIIEDLLDISSLTAGKLKLAPSQHRLQVLVDQAMDAVRVAAKAKGVTLERHAEAGTSLKVTGDAHRLNQVIWNLLSNAVKFTPAGGKVRVITRQQDASAEIIVEDTGDGIQPGFLPFVFDRFRQEDGSMTRQYGGLGLGLSLVRDLVEAHGGHVKAESGGKGCGARFKVTLPLCPEGQGHSTKHDAKAGDKGGSRQDLLMLLAGKKVLVVDDHHDSRVLAASILRRRGADVVECDSVPEALETVRRFVPDVVVTDLGMPGKDGFELLRTLQTQSRERNVKTPATLALSGFAQASDKKKVLDAGFDGYMAKPIQTEALVNEVNRLAADARSQPNSGPDA